MISKFLNATAAAPHVALNLRGDFVFANGTARACMFGEHTDRATYTALQAVGPGRSQGC